MVPVSTGVAVPGRRALAARPPGTGTHPHTHRSSVHLVFRSFELGPGMVVASGSWAPWVITTGASGRSPARPLPALVAGIYAASAPRIPNQALELAAAAEGLHRRLQPEE